MKRKHLRGYEVFRPPKNSSPWLGKYYVVHRAFRGNLSKAVCICHSYSSAYKIALALTAWKKSERVN